MLQEAELYLLVIGEDRQIQRMAQHIACYESRREHPRLMLLQEVGLRTTAHRHDFYSSLAYPHDLPSPHLVHVWILLLSFRKMGYRTRFFYVVAYMYFSPYGRNLLILLYVYLPFP